MPGPKALPFSATTASVLLDAIRAIAALLVLLEHWRNDLFIDFPDLHDRRLLAAPVYLVCAAGHQAVVIFFVLSGYLISGSVMRTLRLGRWNWPLYLAHRLVRLWIVLLPALLLGAFWDHLGIFLQQAPNLYSGAGANHMSVNVREALSWRDLLGNAVFLQTIAVPPYGSNGALWSLANEFWYYMLFPLAACILGRVQQRPVELFICAALLCSIVLLLTKAILLLFPIWLLGALLHVVPRKPTALWMRLAAVVGYAAVFFGDVILDHRGWIGRGALGDLLLGLATFGLVWVLLGAVRPAQPSAAAGLSRLTAKFSYTLYVAHTPLLTFLAAFAVGDTRWIPSARTVGLSLCVLAIVIGYAWLLAMATEFRTDKVRGWVESRLRGMGATPAV